MEKIQNDIDFISGGVKNKTFIAPSYYADGYFEISKNGVTKKFYIRNYFDLSLRRWENEIDNINTEKGKMSVIKKAILDIQNDWVNVNYPLIQEHKDVCIKHLNVIKEYLKKDFKIRKCLI